MIQNIIFDMGNVLLEYNPQVSLDLFCRTEQEKDVIRRELFLGPEWVQGDLGNMTCAQKYESARARVPEHMHSPLEQCTFGWSFCIRPVPGAFSFLEYVKRKGFSVYLLSNASDEFYDYFPGFFPLASFDGVVISSDVHMVKPDAGIYRHLLDACRLKPEECLFIDDMEENVKGAKQMGMQGEVFLNDFENIKIRYGL